MKPTKKQLFKRQTTLSELGEVGQKKLQNASVLVVGCGGLGSPIAVHLAASGVGKLHLVDFDVVSISNLHRQVFYSLDDVGKSKVEVLATFIKKRAPFTHVGFTNQLVTKKNIFELTENVTIVVDGTDSLPTKYLLNDACVIQNKPLVYGSLYKFDGYVATFNILQKNGTYSANLRDAFPEMATDIPNCEEAGTLNTIVSLIAAQQANEVLKLITKVGVPLANELLIYNSLNNTQLKMKLKKLITKEEILQFFKKETYFDASCKVRKQEWLIDAKSLKEQLSNSAQSKPILVSLIENLDVKYPFDIALNTTILKLKNEVFLGDKNKKYVFICNKGNTSYHATKLMREKYPEHQFYSLIDGITNY